MKNKFLLKMMILSLFFTMKVGYLNAQNVAKIGTAEYATLQTAVNAVANGETITLLADVAENVTLTEATGLYYTIDGNDNTMNGTFSVNSLSDTEDNRRITIKNINFVDEADANVDFITSVKTNHYPRLTVEGCTFTGSGNEGDVAVRLKSSHSVIIKDCTGTGLHSFLQNTSGWNLTVENVAVNNSKGGLALGTVQGVTIKGCNITVDTYGIRMDAQYNNNAIIESNTVNAFIPVVVRKASVDSDITFTGTNTMTQTNTDGLWCAIGTSEYEYNGVMPTPPTGNVTVTMNDTSLPMDGVYGEYAPAAKIGETEYKTLAEAIAAADNQTVTILNDIEISEMLTIQAGKTVTLDLNGKTIAGTDNTSKNFSIIDNRGTLTIKDSSAEKTGKMTLLATIDSDWSRYSAVVANNPGGKLIIENGTIEHLGGTDMAYAIDNLTNGKGTYAETIVNGGTIKSPYRAIRQFLNGVEAQNILTINGGKIEGTNKSIFFHDPSKNANSGTLTITSDAALYGDIYLFVTAGSTEWPVEVSIAAAALKDGAEVISANVPAGYVVENVNGTYGVEEQSLSGAGTEENPYLISDLDDLVFFRDQVNSGENYFDGQYIELAADIDMAGVNWVGIGSATADHGFMGNFDGKNFKIKNLTITNPTLDSDGYAYAGLFAVTEGTDKDHQNTIKNLTIENVTITTTGHIVSAAIAYPYYTIVDNVKVCGVIAITGGDYTAGVLAYTRRCVNASNLSIVGNTNSFVKGNKTVGGVISDIQMNGGLTAEYSNFNASGVTVTGEKSVGGISGIIAGQTLDKCSIKNVTLSCEDPYRIGVVSGSLGEVSTISNVTVENVTGATAIVGASFDTGKPVEARIENKYYATIAGAMNVATDEDVISIANNIELTETLTIPAGKTVTLDLNGKTITGTPTEATAYQVIQNLGTLTITDNTEAKAGAVVCNHTLSGSTSYAVNTIVNSGSLTIEAGTIENKSTASIQIGYAIDNNSTSYNSVLTIKGGKLTVSGSGYYDGIRQFCNSMTVENSVIIEGGEVSSLWMQNPSDGTQQNTKDVKGSFVITGGKLNALYLEPSTAFTGSISGGHVVSISRFQAAEGRDIENFITGGTFSTDVTAYCAEGFVCVANGDGTYGVVADPSYGKVAKIGDEYYETLAEAVAAAQNNDEITLIADFNEFVSVSKIEKTIVIDGNNQTMKGLYLGIDNNNNETGDITIQNINFVERGIIVSDMYNVTINNNTFTNIMQYNVPNTNASAGVIYVQADEHTNNVVITNNTITGAEMAGIRLRSPKNATITGNKVSNINHNAITIEQGSYAIAEGEYQIVIENNVLKDWDCNNSTNKGRALRASIDGKTTVTFANNAMIKTNELQEEFIKIVGTTGSAATIDANYWNGLNPAETPNAYLAEGFEMAPTSYYAQYDEVNGLSNLVQIEGLSGTGTETDPYLIENLEDLVFFRDKVNSGDTKYNAEGVYVALSADIDMSSVDWSVNIGDDCNATFDGIFDGKNHKISNLKSVETAQKADGYICTGLFGAIAGKAVVKNFTIENVDINTAEYTGNNVAAVVGFVWKSAGSIENVNVIGDIKINASKVYGVGAIVGYSYYSTDVINNCTVKGNDGSKILAGSAGTAGIIGYCGNTDVKNCTVENVEITAQGLVGGIAGIALGNTVAENNTVKNVTLTTTKAQWINSAAIVVGTMAENGLTVSGTTYDNVEANGELTDKIVGSQYAEQPTTVVPSVEASIENKYYATIADAMNVATDEDVISIANNIELANTVTIPAGKVVTLDLNGKVVSYTSNVPGEDMITVKGGTLIINDSKTGGKLTYANTDQTASNVTVSTISVEPSSTITVNGGIIENKTVKADGSAIYPYAIDILTNGNLGDITVTINGGTVYSDYMAIRQFNNGTACKNTLVVNDGYIYGAKRAIQIHMDNNAAYTTISGGKIEAGDGGYSLCFFPKTSENISVEGGEFIGTVYSGSTTGFITGGTFSENVSYYCAEGYSALPSLQNTFVVGETPTATVNNLGAIVVPAGDYFSLDNNTSVDMPLSFVMQFLANQTEEDMETSPFADWYGDFVITFTGIENDNNSFATTGCYLAGYYGEFGWVKVPVEGILNAVEEGVRYPVMLGVGMGQNYGYICSGVKDFRCAMYIPEEILEANPNLQVKLELSVVDNSQGADAAAEALVKGENIYEVSSFNYDADDFNMSVVARIDNVTYATLSDAISAAQNGQTITMIADAELTETLTIPAGKEVVLDLNGKTIVYNSTTQGEAMITNRGTLTINDGVSRCEEENGVINYNYTGAADPSYGKGNYTISNAGTLTVNGGYITIANLSSHAKYPIDNNSTTGNAILVINEGHLYNYNTSAIRQFCNSTQYENSVTINGGKIEGYCAIWVQNPGKNTVNGQLAIAGGEIITTAKAYVNGTAEIKDVASEIYCSIHGEGGAWDENSSIAITGGTINENVYLDEQAPASVTLMKEATFNGYVSFKLSEGGQLFHNGLTNVTLKKDIEGAEQDGWYTIAMPFSNTPSHNLATGEYELYRYDEATTYWMNHKAADGFGDITLGRGYIYANTADTELEFIGDLNAEAKEITLSYTSRQGSFAGFNLIGNPFTHDITLDNFSNQEVLANGFYVLNKDGGFTSNTKSATISACQGALVKVAEPVTLSINPKAQVTRDAKSNNGQLAINVSNARYSDIAYVSFNEGIGLDKINHRNNEIPMVYVPVEGVNYAIAMMSQDVTEIPVSFKAATMGTYTIGVEAQDCEFSTMTLVDRLTGVETNLLMEDYTFMATTNDNAARFIIRLSENANTNSSDSFVFINNDELVFNNVDGNAIVKIYDMLGRPVAEYNVYESARISTSAFQGGAYIIQMLDENNVKVQKIIID